MSRILTEREPFNYENLLELFKDKQIDSENRFVLHENELHLVKGETDDWLIELESWMNARLAHLTSIEYIKTDGIEYICQVYINTNQIKILYKDITFGWSYYWDFNIWFKKSKNFINDYFKNIIDMKMEESINGLELDSSAVLAIVNKYNLPNSRDLMLMHAIDKYSNEMQVLLKAIDNQTLKDRLSWVIDWVSKFVRWDEEEDEGTIGALKVIENVKPARKTRGKAKPKTDEAKPNTK